MVPVSPDGLEVPSWFDPIEEDPIIRRLLSLPVPVPGELVRRAQRGAHRGIAFSDAQRAIVETFGRSGEARADVAALLESGRKLAPELAQRAVRSGRDPLSGLLVWGAYDRGLRTATRGWRSTRCPPRRSS